MQLKSGDSKPILAIILVAAVFAMALPRVLPGIQAMENWLSDYRFATLAPPTPQDDRIVIATITEETLATLPYRSPVDRGFLARLLRALEIAGVRAVGFDILFDQPTEPAKDDALRQAILDFPVPVVVAQAGKTESLTDQQRAYLRQYTAGMTHGLANLVKDDVDGTVRWIFAGRTAPGSATRTRGLAAALAEALGIRPPARDIGLVYRRGANTETPVFRRFAAQVVPMLPKAWLAGKIVLIGADLPLSDRHRTPFATARGATVGSLPGVVIHAHALAQLLDGRTKPDPGLSNIAIAIVFMAILGLVIAALDIPLPVKSAVFALGLAGFWVAVFALYSQASIPLPLLPPSLAFVASCGGGIAFLGRRDRQQKKFIREAFSHYLSPSIVNQLIADPSKFEVGGERRDVTYLFTDLANFTALTERSEPDVLVKLLNEYIDGMCAIAFEHGATLDKIVGDAVVMFFNAPIDQPDHKPRAVTCGLVLDAFGQAFVERQAAQGIKVGITRIGINSGVAIIGNFGGENFFDYTGYGDMVNTAARLESANKHLGTRICVSQFTAKDCPDVVFRPVGNLVLKGKTEGIDVVEPMSEKRAKAKSTALYRDAFEAMTQNESRAADMFQQVLDIDPDDGLASLHLRRLRDGETGTIIVMGEK
jgi:class 3 adenylate cyclase/CHASE2 domain-containing sensor protein